jgi:hypothetical protein
MDVTRANDAQALQSAEGTGRDGRGQQGERPAWVRPFRRVHRALDASVRLIAASLATAARSERGARRRPIRSSQNLEHAEARLARASARLNLALRELAETTACLGREPESGAGVPALLLEATTRWVLMAQSLDAAASEVFTLHENVLGGLRSGALVPERDTDLRPRIVLAPRPALVRAFLAARQLRAADRISAVLQRRRRASCPAALSVPRHTSQGRAPPASSLCLLQPTAQIKNRRL